MARTGVGAAARPDRARAGAGHDVIPLDVKPEEHRLTGIAAYVARLKAGETISFRESGNSMTPRIKSRSLCTYQPIKSADDIKVGDAVFCKVGGNHYTHLVTAIDDRRGFQISNNHGHINGWTTLEHVYGKVIRIEK
jgi:hypothetical protein